MLAPQKTLRKMKVLGIDDNSEAFSLLLTTIAGVLLFIFAYLLNKRVMGNKISSDVSVASPCRARTHKNINFSFRRSQNQTVLSGKPLFNGISKETAKDLSKLN